MNERFRRVCRVTILCGLVTTVLARAEEPAQPPAGSSLWEVVEALYATAKASGEQIPGDIYDWLKQDLSNVGSWEYRVDTVPRRESAALEQLLDGAGADRWECIWIERDGGNYRLVFKRPARSYLEAIPEWDLLRLMRGGEAGE